MASLFIKDAHTAARASELANLLGVTKTEAVRVAVEEKIRSIGGQAKGKSFSEKLADWRRNNPMPPRTGFVADKAFYDSLNEE